MKQLKKHLIVWSRLIRLELMTDLQYRLNFLFTFLATTAWLICELLFIHFLLQSYHTIAGWNEYQIGLLVGTNQIWVGGAFYLIIWPSLVTFAELLRSGAADKIFTLPIGTRFYVSIFKFNWTSLSIAVNGVVLMIYCMIKLQLTFTFLNIICYFVLLLVSGWIIYCIQYIAMSTTFWFTKAGSILYFVNILDRFTRFPYEIFAKGILFIFFTFVVPVVIISNVPVRALLGILDVKLVLYSIITAVIFTIISQIVWKVGLRRYESASS